ncbi:NAD(P)H-binding protein [Pedobacter sp. L105]|uniref:NAD(P)H-binding protein n=1 Tax=Pedobacter sp. L105 TaxID=1641871 RepID=UPI00131E1466|nr:NAD(P)H-binding protein [Pedobacter sp. L105]
MKIVLTGSIGNIGKPLTKELVEKGHAVTVITSKTDRQQEIEALGATAAIGSTQDAEFLTATFKGADIVYLVEIWEVVGSLFDKEIDFLEGMRQIGRNYKQAVEQSGVKQIVHLSSIGAHAEKGFGMLSVHHDVETILNQLPNDVSIKFMRPVNFYTNLYRSMQTIKEQSAIVANYGGDEKEPWVSPLDIASVIAEEMEKYFTGRTFRYIASDEISPNEVAALVGEAIHNKDLKWIAIEDEQLLNGMLGFGLNPEMAKGLVEMGTAQRSGTLYEDFYLNKPILGKVKFKDFVKEFAQAFNQK